MRLSCSANRGNSGYFKISLLVAAVFTLVFFCVFMTGSAEASEGTEQPALGASVVFDLTPTPVPVWEKIASGVPEPEPTPFTFLWLSDTQRLAGHGDEYAQTAEWVLGELEPRNVVCFLHTGDIVGVRNSTLQWERAETILKPLKERMPSLIIAGNHDFDDRMFNYEPFRKGVYTEEELAALENDPASYNRGQGRYMLETFGGIDFLFVGIAQNPDDEALDWVGSVLDRYPDRVAVLLMHGYLFADGRLIKSAKYYYDRLIAPHANVRLVLCGHYAGYTVRRDDFDDGHFAETVVCNVQDDNGRRGTVQFLTIDPAASMVSLYAWSPVRYEKEAIVDSFEIDLS